MARVGRHVRLWVALACMCSARDAPRILGVLWMPLQTEPEKDHNQIHLQLQLADWFGPGCVADPRKLGRRLSQCAPPPSELPPFVTRRTVGAQKHTAGGPTVSKGLAGRQDQGEHRTCNPEIHGTMALGSWIRSHLANAQAARAFESQTESQTECQLRIAALHASASSRCLLCQCSGRRTPFPTSSPASRASTPLAPAPKCIRVPGLHRRHRCCAAATHTLATSLVHWHNSICVGGVAGRYSPI